jgi:hypothetical protein
MANKVKFACHYVENNTADLSRLDLEERICQLVGFIHLANGHEM